MFIHALVIVMCTAAQDPTTMMVETPMPLVEDPNSIPPAVAALLGGYETAPTPAQWKELSALDRASLLRIAQDPTQTVQRRVLVLEGLAVVDPQVARGVAQVLARGEQEDTALRAGAVRVLAKVLPPEVVFAELRPILESASAPSLRVVAAQELVRMHRPAACRAVQTQRGRDSDHAALWKDVPRTCR